MRTCGDSGLHDYVADAFLTDGMALRGGGQEGTGEWTQVDTHNKTLNPEPNRDFLHRLSTTTVHSTGGLAHDNGF